MGDFSRARDIKITVARQQGVPLTMALNSGTFDHGLTSEEIGLTGEDAPRVEGINGPVSLQLDANQIDQAIYDLFDAQRAFNKGVANNDTYRVSATFTISLPNGTRVRYRMPKCTVHTGTSAWSGATERVTTPFTLQCKDLVRVS
jgi:hypothetical protein